LEICVVGPGGFFRGRSSGLRPLPRGLAPGREVYEKKFQPASWNIGFNVGEAGGQTVMHCHCHVIPRYAGDVENPRGGVRGGSAGEEGVF